MNERKLQNKVLAFLVSLCMICTVFAGMTNLAFAADVSTDGATVTGGDTITADGSYTVASDATGTITIADTVKTVALTGNGTSNAANAELTIKCKAAGTDLTINNVYIKNTTDINTIDFTGTGNKLTLEGTNLLEQMSYVNSAGIHVGSTSDLTVNGSGTLYQYKYSAGSGIGGNVGEQNGKITFESGNIFIKGSKTGALIGTDTGAAGDIYIKGGNLNLVAKAQGAAIGGSKSSNGGNVYISGGNTTITCDFNGSAIGKGGSGKDGGTLHMTGGSLKTYVTANGASSWGLTGAGDSDVCITAAKQDGTTNNVYKYKLDTTDLAANSSGGYVVKVDGSKYYSGGLHGYDYSANDTSTMSNWTASTDKNLYLYLTGENHTITVNGKTAYDLTWNSDSKTFTSKDATYDTSWYNTTDKSFTLSTKAQLAGLAAIVNGTAKDAAGDAIAQDTFSGKTVTLAKDIALDSSNDKYTKASGTFGASSYPMKADYYTVNDDADIWTPIGSGVATANSAFKSRNYFSGTFDGNGHTVSGIYTDGSETGSTVQGLFGCLGGGGLIENVTTEGCITAKMVAGGVAAYVNGGTIENCTNKAIVYANGGEKAGTGLENGTYRAGAAGGIAGNAASETNNAVISDCTNEGTVTCTNTKNGGRAGGILGLVDASGIKGSITGCSNSAPVDAYQYSGGIIGMDASAAFTIDKSFNTGKIKAHSPGSAYTGGIVATSSGKISNCYNRGDVTIEFNGPTGKAAHAGGIGDALAGGVENCYNTGTVTMSGTATSWSSMEPICVSGTVTNCYYLDKTKTATTTSEHGTSKTADEMKTADFITALNGTAGAFTQDTQSTYNEGYPILSWQNAADLVIAKIDAIGTVSNASASKIKAARAAYDALTDVQKAKITNYSTLTKDEALLKQIQTAMSKKTTVKAASTGMKSIRVSWKKVNGANGYIVYKAVKKSGNYKKAAVIRKASVIKWNSKKLKTGKRYYYKVKPYTMVNSKNVYGKISNIASARPIPKAPVFKLTAGNNSVKCKWSKVKGVSGYVIYRNNGDGKYVKIFTQKINTASTYKSIGLRDSKTYKYKMRSYKKVGSKKVYSKYTAIKSVMTK